MRSPLPRSASTRPAAAPSPLRFHRQTLRPGRPCRSHGGALGGISHRTSKLIPKPPSACITLDRPLAQPHSTQFTCLRNRTRAKPRRFGVAGFYFHLVADINGLSSSLFENFIHGSPVFAPLLFVNLVLLAMIGLWDMRSRAAGHAV